MDQFEFEPRDGFFDEFLRLRADKKDELTAWLMPQIAARETRQRQRRRQDQENFESALALIVANAFCGHWGGGNSTIHYSRRDEYYAERSPYRAEWFKHGNATSAVDLLEACGLLECQRGSYNPQTGRGRRSTFKATRQLLQGLGPLRIDGKAIEQDAQAPRLVLKDAQKRRVSYDPAAPDLARTIANVDRCNDFLAGHEIDLPLTNEEWEDLVSRRDREGGRKPLLYRKRLYRVFNNGSWTEGGRWYGGWWQEVPSDFRPRITLNGEPTVELDFSGFLTRAAYHSQGLEFEGDPYEIPEIKRRADRSQVTPWETVRPGVKKMHNVMLNSSSEDEASGVKGFHLPRSVKLAEARQLIREYHAPIAHRFLTGYGLILMHRESRVCERVLVESVEAGVPVLPIHDSFIAPQKAEGWLQATMEAAYQEEFWSLPVIKRG